MLFIIKKVNCIFMPYFLYVLVIVLFFLHLFLSKKDKTKKRIVELLLLYLIFFGIGVNGLIAFIGHIFIPDRIAMLIGWRAGSPFQFEVGISNLAFGILGILCVWIRAKHYWMATITGYSIFYFGAAIGHIRQMIIHNNYSPGNAGVYFYQDIIYPIVIIGLFLYLIFLKKDQYS